MCNSALQKLAAAKCQWAVVHGPGLGFVASAQRLGWTVESATSLVTDDGVQIDLAKDPPAIVKTMVRDSVWRWRWRRVEEKHPHLVQGVGGHGPFIQPINYSGPETRPSGDPSNVARSVLRS